MKEGDELESFGEIFERVKNKTPSLQTPPVPQSILKLRSVADRGPLPQLDYIVEDLLPSPGVSVLSARPKVGKSTFARYLSTLVASGSDFAGRKVRQGKVLYIGLEDHPGELDSQLKAICPELYRENIHFLLQMPDSKSTLLEGIQIELSKTPYVLVVIDTLVQSTRLDDWNDYGKTSRAINEFRRLAIEYGCHVLLIHHNSKNREANGEQALLGSTGISASVDTVLTLSCRSGSESTVISSERLRYGRKLEGQELCLDPSTGQIKLGESEAGLMSESLEEQIISILLGESFPLVQDEIREKTGRKAEAVSAALKRLTEQKRVNVSGTGTRGDPKKYQLTEVN